MNEAKAANKISNFGIDGIETKAPRVVRNFIFENCSYNTKFTILDASNAFDKVEEESGLQIHGILGNEFLIENEWVIDFEKRTVYSGK